MSIAFLMERFEESRDQDAIVWRDRSYEYGALLDEIEAWRQRLEGENVPAGCVTSLESDFSPTSLAIFLALIDRGCITVPLTSSLDVHKDEFREVAEIELRIEVPDEGDPVFERTGREASHEILVGLKQKARPGLVFFSSGSTGEPKAMVHDCLPLLEKFTVRRHASCMLTFLLFDHMGGVNTILYALSNGGCLVSPEERTPDAICSAIERWKIHTLPATPTFLNLLMLAGAHERYDLSSLRLITYGTEMMPEATLKRVHALFPDVRLLQTYGLSEVGVLRSKSRSSDSLWVKVGGEGFDTRIVDGMLEINARSAMLGYLNAESPFTEDGWLKTGDAVEQDGEYVRFLGRKSEIINIGGEKVYPAEVEGVLQSMEGVADVAVSSESNPITGEVVKARVFLAEAEPLRDFKKRMHAFCRERLARYKIPQKVVLVDRPLYSERFKKMR